MHVLLLSLADTTNDMRHMMFLFPLNDDWLATGKEAMPANAERVSSAADMVRQREEET